MKICTAETPDGYECGEPAKTTRELKVGSHVVTVALCEEHDYTEETADCGDFPECHAEPMACGHDYTEAERIENEISWHGSAVAL